LINIKPITAQEKFDFPRANAFLARAQALLWVRDWQVCTKKLKKQSEPAFQCWRNYEYFMLKQYMFGKYTIGEVLLHACISSMV
jgi:hypothetical protein